MNNKIMNSVDKNIKIWVGEARGYRLLDSGDKKKLEEVDGERIVRAEPRAWWQRSLPAEEWKNTQVSLEKVVNVFDGIKAKIKFKESSKHIGIFPEQAEEWKWIEERVKKYEARDTTKKLNILNLFGYTGIASLVAAKAGLSREAGAKWGANVTHVDASKQSVEWARENQKLSDLEGAPIRWIVDDVIKFLKKEIKKGAKYDCLIMDPPSYGKGPKGEVWKIEEKLPSLLKTCREILSDEPLFVILNMYSTELSSISIANLLSDMMIGLGGTVEPGELVIKPASALASAGKQEGSEKLLPMSIFALWSKD